MVTERAKHLARSKAPMVSSPCGADASQFGMPHFCDSVQSSRHQSRNDVWGQSNNDCCHGNKESNRVVEIAGETGPQLDPRR
jgi:hypothetical protein